MNINEIKWSNKLNGPDTFMPLCSVRDSNMMEKPFLVARFSLKCLILEISWCQGGITWHW
jgi:hypothetical protein